MSGLPSFVAVHGAKRSGKGAITDHLVSAYGYQRVKFAGALKDMIRVLLREAGLSHDLVERCIESDLKEVPVRALHGKSTRYAQQVIGTEWRDLIHTTMWSRISVGSIRGHLAARRRVAVDDLRFTHEVDMTAPEGAAFWLVLRGSPAAEQAVPDAAIEMLSQGCPVDLGGDVVERMAAELFRHCGFREEETFDALVSGRSADRPIDILNGATARRVVSTLRHDFRALMEAPWSPAQAASTVHSSDVELPRDIFRRTFHNDGGLRDLHSAVDEALLAA
jgi:hypothetical protein